MTLITWGTKNYPIRSAFPGPTNGGEFGVAREWLFGKRSFFGVATIGCGC